MSNLEKLYEIQKYRNRISKQEELIQYYETMSHSLGGGGYEEKVQCTRNLDAPFVKWIYKKVDAEAVLKEMKVKFNDMVEEVTPIIESLESIDYRKIINYKFILGYDWSDICDLMHISLSTAHRYLKKSMLELDPFKS